jgi:DNA-binding CsgD family transcriptional regulator
MGLVRIAGLIDWELLKQHLGSHEESLASNRDEVLRKYRLLLLCIWYGLDEGQCLAECRDRLSFQVFADIKDANMLPTTRALVQFRKRLEKLGIRSTLDQSIDHFLATRGLMINKGAHIHVQTIPKTGASPRLPVSELAAQQAYSEQDSRRNLWASSMLDAAFNRILMGVVFIRSSGEVMHANQSAQDLLSSAGWLQNSPAKKMELTEGALRTLRNCPGTAVTLHTGHDDLLILVEPFCADGSNLRGIKDRRSGKTLLIRKLGHHGLPDVAQLKGLFRLTSAEARLAIALCSGGSIADYAKASNISVATARTQLRAVLGKTGVKRQSDLLRILLTIPASIMTETGEPSAGIAST